MPQVVRGPLSQQLHLFGEQADRLVAQGGQVVYDDLRSVVCLGLSVYAQILRMETNAAQFSAAGNHLESSQVKHIAELYAEWYGFASKIWKLVRTKTHGDLEILAGDLDRACKHARVPALHFAEILELDGSRS